MLSFFKISRTFHSVSVFVTVDVDAGEASILVKRDRRIVAVWDESLRMHPSWRDPKAVETWLSEEINVPGKDGTCGRLEAWHTYPVMCPRSAPRECV